MPNDTLNNPPCFSTLNDTLPDVRLPLKVFPHEHSAFLWQPTYFLYSPVWRTSSSNGAGTVMNVAGPLDTSPLPLTRWHNSRVWTSTNPSPPVAGFRGFSKAFAAEREGKAWLVEGGVLI